MKRRDTLRLARGGAIALLLGRADIAAGASIVAVRVWPAREYTRVTIESDTPLVAHHFLTEAPTRLVVDIDNLELSAALRDLVGKIRPDDPFIAGVRIGQFQPHVVRLVLDLKQGVAPQQFTLEPVAAYQHRLVLDLFPAQASDPMLALLKDRPPLPLGAASMPVPPASSSTSSRSTSAFPAGSTSRPVAVASAASAAPSSTTAAREVQDALGEFIGRIGPGAASAALPPGATTTTTTTVVAGGPGTLALPPLRGAVTPTPVPSLAAAANAPIAPLTPAEKRKVDRLLVVAIDPGHGGEDPGAIGPSGLREKDVVLQIAMQLRDRLNAKPGVRVLMTRDDDFFVPLAERVAKAQRVQADLFVSIHADAFLTPDARGASVFALSSNGHGSSAAARWMAQRENAADSVGGVNTRVRDTQVLRAMLDMSTTAQIKDSLRVGGEVLDRMGRVGKLHRGHVEQASFAVLKAPDIPSILVETAFISNPQEEDRLRDADYQKKLVEAVFAGIERYFAKSPPVARRREL